MANPVYHAPKTGDAYSAGDVTQFLASHPATILYNGTAAVTGAASASGNLGTNTGAATQWVAQPFTTIGGQTTVTRVELDFLIQGTGADLTIDLRTDNAGNPSTTVLVTTTFPLEFEPGSAALISVPLNITGLSAATKYHIVVNGTASTTNYCNLKRGTTSGSAALTSSNGTSWASAGVTLLFNVYQGINGVPRNLWCDSGSLWAGYDYAMGSAGTSGPPTTERVYCGTFRSLRTLTYSGGLLTTVG